MKKRHLNLLDFAKSTITELNLKKIKGGTNNLIDNIDINTISDQLGLVDTVLPDSSVIPDGGEDSVELETENGITTNIPNTNIGE